jgi:dethiobiotin synthetase
VKHRVVVCGTGTEVGKTHVACALIAHLVSVGEDAIGLKPVESGVDGHSETDASLLAQASATKDLGACFAFRDPVSPHLAARREGRVVRLAEVDDWICHHDSHWQVVETAGGLLSPLSSKLTNLDLTRALRPTTIVLCAPDRLGVLHDVTAALLALRGVGLEDRTIVVLSEPSTTDDSTGSNAAEIEALQIAERPTVFPRASLAAASTQLAAGQLAAQAAPAKLAPHG